MNSHRQKTAKTDLYNTRCTTRPTVQVLSLQKRTTSIAYADKQPGLSAFRLFCVEIRDTAFSMTYYFWYGYIRQMIA